MPGEEGSRAMALSPNTRRQIHCDHTRQLSMAHCDHTHQLTGVASIESNLSQVRVICTSCEKTMFLWHPAQADADLVVRALTNATSHPRALEILRAVCQVVAAPGGEPPQEPEIPEAAPLTIDGEQRDLPTGGPSGDMLDSDD